MRECPKCGHRSPGGVEECARCGIIYDRWRARAAIPASAPPAETLDTVENGRLGAAEWKILGAGLVAAIVVYSIPFLRFVFSALVTLFHELGHAVAGWLLGHPSLPAFDFIYGGGFTHMGEFRPLLALSLAGGFLWMIWHFRQNRRAAALIGTAFVVWLVLVSAEWRRELVFAAAGHAFEFILAGILFYQALSGVGWRNPELERPLGAFVAFFVQIHSMAFALRLVSDRSFLSWYREGKGGALMNDLEVVALDLTIRFGLEPGIEGVARLLLAFSMLPICAALLWYVRRSRVHAMLRSLRTIDATV